MVVPEPVEAFEPEPPELVEPPEPPELLVPPEVLEPPVLPLEPNSELLLPVLLLAPATPEVFMPP